MGQKVTKNQIETQEAWTSVTYQNSWVTFGATYGGMRYMKDSLGFVHLEGLMKSGTMGQVAFTLPTGYRPGFQQYLLCASNGGSGIIDLATNGTVTPQIGSNASFGINVVFKAEN